LCRWHRCPSVPNLKFATQLDELPGELQIR
jgi:hypothetical protein